jgi:hypothetical protein
VDNVERAADTARGEFSVSRAPLPRRGPDAPPPLASRSKTLAPTDADFRLPFSRTEPDLESTFIFFFFFIVDSNGK